MSENIQTPPTAAEVLRASAEKLDEMANQLDRSAVEHRERVARQEAQAIVNREQANAHREAANRLDRLTDGGVVVNVHVTESGDDVTQAVVNALQGHTNKADDAEERACAWADYRKDYSPRMSPPNVAHQAFLAGWDAHRDGDQSGVQR